MSNKINGLVEFGDFRLDLEKRFLWFGNEQIHLPLKQLEVLCLLVEARGELVDKEELLERVWADSFVEESNLSRQIYLLRKTFKHLCEQDLIATVPRRGYRFTSPVRDVVRGEVELTIEKYTESQTLIEIEDIPDDSIEQLDSDRQLGSGQFGFDQHRRRVVFALGGLILLISVLAFAEYRSWTRSVSGSGIRSVAVLPFRSIDQNGENKDQSLGLADILITRLSNIKELRIRSLAAVSNFTQEDAAAFGRKLDTDAVLEGAIFRTEDKVRVTARLLRTIDGSVVWTGEFEKLLQDEMKLQDEIALEVADALAINLDGGERAALAKRYTSNPNALALYQKGRVAWNKRTTEGMLDAERLFRNAIEQDPNFALAYVGLADIFSTQSTRHPEMLEAIRKALEIDPGLGEAYASLGFYETFAKWDWQRAEESFKRSIELNTNYATAHHWYAQLLAIQGRYDEAKAEMARALEINPISYNYLADLGQIYYFNREYAAAEEYCRKALEIYPDFVFARFYLHQIYLKTGEYELAVKELLAGERSALANPNDSAARQKEINESIERWRNVFHEGGIRAFIEKRTPEVQDPSSCYLHAQNYSFLGQTEKAIACLEKSYFGRAFLAAFVKAEPAFDNLRSEPRYAKILRDMKLIQ